MSTLTFGTMKLPVAAKGREASLPDVMGISNVQHQIHYEIGDEDEIYQGYGRRANGYPYRIYTEYSRELKTGAVRTAVLENAHMRAVFLPDYGGRLWQLRDLDRNRELLYVNDVLRGSNLAIRGPWFSGGVEWNMGVIGHSPLTMETVFAGALDTPEGPVLRLYAYERIRDMAYQMDFWLDEQKPALNCHMAIFNQHDQVTPMYWWSNIASPCYPGGRLFVPAHKAYSSQKGGVRVASIPMDGDLDVSRYETIPCQRDYFFELDRGAPRWLAHVDGQGRGLLHSSTERLQSRKLFVWGNTVGSHRWQEFLTEKAGPYLEVQAGLGKTQYGCLPMSPHTVWQWTERYEGIELQGAVEKLDFDSTCESISRECFPENALQQADQRGRSLLRQQARTVIRGSGDGMLASAARSAQGREILPEHLDFASGDPAVVPFLHYLETGDLGDFPGEMPPAYDLTGEFWRSCLTRDAEAGRCGWYGYYALALLDLEAERPDLAEDRIEKSLELRETAWAWYVKAVLLLRRRQTADCREAALRCMTLCPEDSSVTKLCMQVLAAAESWQTIADLRLNEGLREDKRVKLLKAKALSMLDRNREALAILEENGGMVAPDTRECETDVGQLWQTLQLRLTGKLLPIPEHMDFYSGERKK